MKTFHSLTVATALAGLALCAGAAHYARELQRAWLASELVGMKVVSQHDETLGKIDDVVVHPGGRTAYAVLSIGGWLGVGDKLFAMPWSVLRTTEPDPTKKDSTRLLVLPLEKEQLQAAPGFDKKKWPNTANPEWMKDVDEFYSGHLNPNSKHTLEASLRKAVITWRVSELKGTDVKTPTGETLGEIKDVAIDTNGRVSYAVLSVGGFIGIGDRLVPVPWDSLAFTLGGDKGDKKLVTLAATKEQLEKAPQFKEGKEHCAEMCDPKWITGVYTYFSCPIY